MKHIYVFRRIITTDDFTYPQYINYTLEEFESYEAMMSQVNINNRIDEDYHDLIISECSLVGIVVDVSCGGDN